MLTSLQTQDTVSALEIVYDYIVIGAGTSGPVVARRLAEGDSTAKVLLFEAGPPNEDIVDSQMVMGWENLVGTALEWGYDTVPQKHANGRIINISRGKFLGGTSAINGTLIARGPKADYDKWAEVGCTGWGWDNVLPYFKKSESFHATSELPASPYHGISGPLHTTVHPLAPISTDLLQSYCDKGFEYKPDMFAQGEYEGVGNAIRIVYKGIRTSGADFVSSATMPHNLTVLTRTLALRILLSRPSPNNRLRALAVEVEDQKSPETAPRKYVIRARREIVLSAGTYNSPALLMHSGIGPREHLEEVHMDCIVDLKGVGENLQDHVKVYNFYQLNKPNLTYDHLVYPPGTVDSAIKEWKESQTGVMSRVPFGLLAYKRMNEIMKDTPEWKGAQATTGLEDPTGQGPTQPHIEYFNSELYGGSPPFRDLPCLPEHSVFSMLTMLCGPQARGTVRLPLSSDSHPPDPHAHPIIDHAYLSSPLDVAILAEGCRLAHEIVTEGKATKDHITGSWPEGRSYPQDIEEWKNHVRENAWTTYDGAGTCKMGPESDERAVVDERLRVRGVLGLRVADCSIMPWVNNGHTQAPAFMIGEKCADLILEDYNVT